MAKNDLLSCMEVNKDLEARLGSLEAKRTTDVLTQAMGVPSP